MASNIAVFCQKTSLLLACALPFLAYFDPGRNIDQQGYILLISGLFAWINILIKPSKVINQFSKNIIWLIIVLIISSILSMLLTPKIGYGFLGAPLVRLGAGSIVACIGIGLLTTQFKLDKIIRFLYLTIATFAALSLPYAILRSSEVDRIGGLSNQATIFSCILGVGFIFGLYLLANYKKYSSRILFIQAYLFSLILLSQTRAIIILVLILAIIWTCRQYGKSYLKNIALAVFALSLLLLSFQAIHPNRLIDGKYAGESISYRFELQKQASSSIFDKPLFGYGPGNMADTIPCHKIQNIDLQKTCSQGYFFNSSHNIFLDRIITYGWVYGITFMAIVALGLFRSYRSGARQQIFGYALLLIAGYYMTNVTGVVLELILWIVLISCLRFTRTASRV